MSTVLQQIKDDAQRHFPGCKPEIVSESDERWVLLVHDKGLTHRFSAPNLTALARMSADLLEYEDERDEWEQRNA